MMISIPLNVGDFREAVIYKSLREIKREIKTLQTQVESLRDTTIKYKFRDISGEEARKEITSYLELKPKDDKSLTIFSISQELEISADIVEDVLESLQVEGKLKLN